MSYRRSRSNSAVSIQAAMRGLISRELKSQALAEHRGSIKRGLGDVVIETVQDNGGACMLQAGGHPNSFKRDEEDPHGIIVKEGTSHEKAIYESLQKQPLSEFTPRYHGSMENGVPRHPGPVPTPPARTCCHLRSHECHPLAHELSPTRRPLPASPPARLAPCPPRPLPAAPPPPRLSRRYCRRSRCCG